MDENLLEIIKILVIVVGVLAAGGGVITLVLWLTEPTDASRFAEWDRQDKRDQAAFEARLRRANEGR